MVRVIAIDLDDTLLTSDKTIPPENKAAVALAGKQGVRVVIVTARGWPNTQDIYRELNLETPILLSSGARLIDGSGREIWARTLPQTLAEEVLAFANEHQIPLRIYIGQETWNNMDYDPMRSAKYNYAKRMASGQIMDHPPYQIFTKGAREVELLVERFGEAGEGFHCSVMTYSDRIPELCILHPQSTKGEALAALCAEWRVPREDVMAIGDSMNDLSMIEWAGIGVAMPWGSEALKERADWVTAEGNPAGVAEAIHRALAHKHTPVRESAEYKS